MKKLNNYIIKLFTIITVFFFFNGKAVHPQQSNNCTPGWNGTVLIDCETVTNWSVEASNGSSGFISTASGFIGNAIQFNWNIGSGDWVQAKYTFPQPIDLSQKDIFGLSLKGNGGFPNNVDLMFADVNNVFFGAHFENVNDVRIWMKNLALPKKLFYYYFQTESNPAQTDIDWAHINRFFVVVKRPNGFNTKFDNDQLVIDHLQADRAADWPRQQQFEIVTNQDTVARNKAVSYIFSQQRATGLIASWKEEPNPKAWLYDEALALIVLSREGIWLNGIPKNDAALRAKVLVDFITSKQKPDGHWPRAWYADTGTELVDDLWVGDQAWWVIAVAQYVAKSQDLITDASMQRGADWLALRIGTNGALVPSTEGNVDTWWAMISTKRFVEANKIQIYLLNKVWDADLQYWWRGLYNDSIPDAFVAMDCATFVGEFAKSSYIQLPQLSLAAISFVHRALMTSDSTGTLCGFDGMGPVSIWCEGTAQYIVAGGEDSQEFLDMLLSLQRSDGGMPGSVDSTGGNAFGWLSNWTGLSSTAWLYFALTESPFISDSATGIENNFPPLKDFKLYQNYPNPFNPTTKIKYQIPASLNPSQGGTFVQLIVYDILGREVTVLVNEEKQPGVYESVFDGSNLPSSIYLYRLTAGEYSETKKLVLLK